MSSPDRASLSTLEEIERRVLWLSVRMVDSANHDRGSAELKVGGHQASSASMVSLMTSLWFDGLRPGDRVAVKPHASPVLHAIHYLLGRLDRSYLTQLRAFGGLQAYPSRTKDPDPIDFSTGSVGLGPASVLFAAAADRYIRRHSDLETSERADERRGPGRYIALLGDAELDEGNVWEAVVDPATQGLANVLWVVDLNRQSLDRVVPGMKAERLERMFAGNGWHVVEAKYGRRLQKAFAGDRGELLRDHIDHMSNEQYQSLFALRGKALRERFLEGSTIELRAMLDGVPNKKLPRLLLNLGGHDLGALRDAYDEAERVTDRPTVIFAYTIKGWGLPLAGDPLNHSALLSGKQIAELRDDLGLDPETEWDRFGPETEAGMLCDQVGLRLRDRRRRRTPEVVAVPFDTSGPVSGRLSTQEAFGRTLVDLTRHPEVSRRMVTASPDVAVSTSLGGWINKVGVYSPEERPDWFGGDRVLRWQPGPVGQHIELGISEMNLFLLLGQLGLTAELSGETLLPIGTVYDPFVLRGLDALVHALQSGARFIMVGTPSGITLASEGGAHQSTITPSVGLELPGVVFAEPAYGRALEWLLCDGLVRLSDRGRGESLYLRLTTRQIDQAPFGAALERIGAEELRRQVLAGGYRLHEPVADPAAVVATSGPLVVEALRAAEQLEAEGIPTLVLDVTSLDRVHRGWLDAERRSRTTATKVVADFHLGSLLLPAERRLPIVTLHDAHPHAMAWLGAVFGQPTVPLGVEHFGESGRLQDLYALHHLDPSPVVNAVLALL